MRDMPNLYQQSADKQVNPTSAVHFKGAVWEKVCYEALTRIRVQTNSNDAERLGQINYLAQFIGWLVPPVWREPHSTCDLFNLMKRASWTNEG